MGKRHKIPDSKYSFEMDEKGAVKFFRYDEDVTDLVGNNLAFNMAYMIDAIQKENEQLKKVVKGVSVPKETVRFNLEKLYKSKNVNSGYRVKLTEDVSLVRDFKMTGWIDYILVDDKKGTIILSDDSTADVLLKGNNAVLLQKRLEDGELKIFHLSREDFDKAASYVRAKEEDIGETEEVER